MEVFRCNFLCLYHKWNLIHKQNDVVSRYLNRVKGDESSYHKKNLNNIIDFESNSHPIHLFIKNVLKSC